MESGNIVMVESGHEHEIIEPCINIYLLMYNFVKKNYPVMH